MTNQKGPNSKERIQEIINWTLPGITMYYRDSNLPQDIIDNYEVGKIIRSKTFVDVSSFAGKPTTNCRFIFASSKAAPMFKVNPATEKWGLYVINCNSYFKILDVYKKEDITQIFLIHIPYKGIELFSSTALRLGELNIEEQFISKARESLQKKMKAEIPAVLNEKEWIDRTHFPIGLNAKNEFFSLEVTEPLMPMAVPMVSAIKKMTNDLSDLNEVPILEKIVAPKKETTQNKPGQKQSKKSGFWSNLFGKNE